MYGIADIARNPARPKSGRARGAPACPCELDCYGGAGRVIRVLYRPACRRMLPARRCPRYLVALSGVLAFLAGLLLGSISIFHWMLLSLPLTVLSWATLLGRSKILSTHAAAVLCLLQLPTLGSLIGHPQTFNLYGAGAANLLLWSAVPLWLAPKSSPALVSAGSLVFGLAAGWCVQSLPVGLPGTVVVCSLTLYAARKRPSMPYGLFHPGYLTTL